MYFLITKQKSSVIQKVLWHRHDFHFVSSSSLFPPQFSLYVLPSMHFNESTSILSHHLSSTPPSATFIYSIIPLSLCHWLYLSCCFTSLISFCAPWFCIPFHLSEPLFHPSSIALWLCYLPTSADSPPILLVYLCHLLTPLLLSPSVSLFPPPHVCTLSSTVLVCLPARILPGFSSMLDCGHWNQLRTTNKLFYIQYIVYI